ncbi:MAG: hypothetical protein J6K39_03290 [Clostridia bacterium]|nr:hypothetical protein [Clostridia bacterium]
MTIEEFYKLTETYFSLSNTETQELLDKNFKNKIDRSRLAAMVEIASMYCKDYLDKADEKLKRKVGKVFLSKLDYDKFENESVMGTYERLRRLFAETSAKGINPYKIIYCSVLTDGNLRKDYENRNRFSDNSREFTTIYNTLKETLKTTDAETVALFEKCSTLIAKVYSYRIPHIYNTIRSLVVKAPNVEGGFYAFREEEVIEILKINPSLFSATGERVQQAFSYMLQKIEPIAKDGPKKPLYDDPARSMLAHKTILLRKWLKNNSTLLSVNASSMKEKESFLCVNANFELNGHYAEEFEKFFQNPVTIAAISQIPIEKIKRDAIQNIRTLEKYTTHQNVARYILNNQMIVGMDSKKFGQLVDEIVELDKLNPEEGYFNRFLDFGKTLFASNVEFSVDDIKNKLCNKNAMMALDVSQYKEMELVDKFVDLFFDGKHDVALKVEKLVKEKKQRMQQGERKLRSDIRRVGENIRYLPKILKDEYYSTSEKRERILSLCTQLDDLNERRFALAGTKDHAETRRIEVHNSKQIEEILNVLRDAYEQKRFKVGKKYSGCEALFENMMEYLGECFDDKEAIYDVFKKEIVVSFESSVKEAFKTKENPQLTLFGENLRVEVEDSAIKAPLKKVAKNISQANFEIDTATFDFQK